MTTESQGWDAICIGAGITSLAFAAHVIAREPSARLLIIDKHAVVGGYASVFHRPKAPSVFDCSLHKLSGMNEGGNLKRMFDELGLLDELALKIPATYFQACLPGQALVLANDWERVRHGLIAQFPQEEEAIRGFFNEVNVYGKHGYYQFQMMEGTYEADFSELRYAHRHLKNITVREGLNQRFKDGHLKEIIGATGIYVGGYPEDLGYLYFLHVVYATLCKGNAYVDGASQKLSDTLAERVLKAGGEVLLNTSVLKVLTDESGAAVGVETKRGNFYAPRIYVNASPHYAMQTLFASDEKLQPVTEKLQALKPSRSTTTAYLTTDLPPAELGLDCCETMVFATDDQTAFAARDEASRRPAEHAPSEEAYWALSPMEVTNYHLLNPSNGNAICLNVLDDIRHWPQRRDAGYKEKKKRAVDILVGRLYAAKPALEGHVTYCELSSPRTYQRFTNNTDGAGYGAMVGTDLSGHLFHRQFPVANVHFLSAWVAGPSYEAAFGYAEMKAKQWAA